MSKRLTIEQLTEKEIPTIKFPSIGEYEIDVKDEAFVNLAKLGFKCSSQYYKQGIPGSYKDVYVRENVAMLLKIAENQLPEGYKLKIWDGYRPICIQQRLWNHYRQVIKNNNASLSDDELDFKTSFFVSKPSYNEMQPSLHNTGGAVDLTLIGPDDKDLDMGTEFDAFGDKAWSNHFETYEVNETARNNRRILYNAMINAGFVNLPSEWWHYEYGSKFWAYFKNNGIAIYKGELDKEFKDAKRFPLT